MMTTKKSKKRIKNVPVHYDELKEKHTIHVTPQSWEKAKRLSKLKNISVSVYIEELIRTQDA